MSSMLTEQQQAAAADYRTKRVVDLKKILTERGLKTNGLKEELVIRLAQSETPTEQPADIIEQPAEIAEQPAEVVEQPAEVTETPAEITPPVANEQPEAIVKAETVVAEPEVDEEVPVEPVCDVDVVDLVDYEDDGAWEAPVVDVTDDLADQLASLAVGSKSKVNHSDVASLDNVLIELDHDEDKRRGSKYSSHDNRDKENAGRQSRWFSGKSSNTFERQHMRDTNGRREEKWGHDKFANRYEEPKPTLTNLRTPYWMNMKM